MLSRVMLTVSSATTDVCLRPPQALSVKLPLSLEEAKRIRHHTRIHLGGQGVLEIPSSNRLTSQTVALCCGFKDLDRLQVSASRGPSERKPMSRDSASARNLGPKKYIPRSNARYRIDRAPDAPIIWIANMHSIPRRNSSSI